MQVSASHRLDVVLYNCPKFTHCDSQHVLTTACIQVPAGMYVICVYWWVLIWVVISRWLLQCISAIVLVTATDSTSYIVTSQINFGSCSLYIISYITAIGLTRL